MVIRWQERLLRWRRRFSRAEWAARHLDFALSSDPPHSPGLLLIQVDGLARHQLERALRAGEMPFLRRLLRRRGYQMHTFYPGQPASTPAVQGELHYGVHAAVPAFSFLDPEAGGIGLMMHPAFAKRVEAGLAAEHEGLLRDGSSWSNIYSGGAAPEESHFCAASIGLGDAWRSIRLRMAVTVVLLHLDAVFRLLGLLGLELLIGLWDAAHGVFQQGRRVGKELSFLVARVAVCVGLRELITVGAAIDLARGLPIVHVNFVGYDEQAHRRGPDSKFAHWALLGIDRGIRQLHRAARHSSRRDYDVWIFSDHGQTACRQAERITSGGLEGLVRKHWPAGRLPAQSQAGRRQLRASPGHWIGGPRSGRREDRHHAEARLSVFEQEEFAVAALGPVGHIYFSRDIGAAASRRLAAALVRDGVPGVMWCDGPDHIIWLEAGGEHRLPEHASLLDVDPELQDELAQDLVRLCHHERAGHLVALGWAPGQKPWSFANENGAHAGPSRDEVTGFALLPPATWLPAGTEHHIRPEALRRAVLRRLDRDRPGAASGHPRERGRRPIRPTPLRVVTYNTHGCLGSDGRVTPRRVARVLAQFDADIIALQELDVGRRRSRGEDQVATIAQELNLYASFCPAVKSDGEGYGHALLTRAPMRLKQSRILPRGATNGREPRAALWVSVPWNGRTVHVIGTHLGLGNEERWQQVNELLAAGWLGDVNGHDPVILCGDLNLHPGSRGYRRLAGRLRDVQAHAPAHTARQTFPSIFPVRCLDYIFVSEHFDVHAVQVPRDALTVLTSDHLPLVGDLRLK